MRAAAAHAVQQGHDLGDGRGLAQVEPGPEDGGPQGGQLGFQGRAHGGGEPGRGLHDDVDEERAAGEADLGALPVELVDGLLDGLRGAGPHAAAAVEHAVDGGLAEARLPGDLAQRVRDGRLEGFLPAFCRATARPYFYRRDHVDADRDRVQAGGLRRGPGRPHRPRPLPARHRHRAGGAGLRPRRAARRARRGAGARAVGGARRRRHPRGVRRRLGRRRHDGGVRGADDPSAGRGRRRGRPLRARSASTSGCGTRWRSSR